MLAKTFNPQEREFVLYQKWQEAGAFKPLSDAKDPQHPQDPRKAPYVIMMPPPNVTGSLHIGHALNCTLQDVLIRYARMRGHRVLWQPGTDHAGISTQVVVERQLEGEGLTRRALGREAFLQRAWQWKEEKGGIILDQQRRLGVSADWSRERFTLDEGLSQAVLKVFIDLYDQGLIYRAQRLVNWDPKLLTVLSDLEVNTVETSGAMTYIRYPLEGDPHHFIPIATTRPETLLGDQAIAVHPEDERYRSWVGRWAIVPLVGRRVPILADEQCDPELGTGAVKITPAHDFKDFEVGQRQGLTPLNIFDEHGRVNEAAPPPYRGLDRFVARQRILEDLKAQGFFLKTEEVLHRVPYGQKSGVILEPRLTKQWFVDAKTLAQPALKAVREGRTKILPESQEKVYFTWLENIQPWCISRQLWWGHRIPAWYGPDGKVFVASSEDKAREKAAAHYGADHDGKNIPLTQDEDVLDTWFSSALWPFSTLGWPEKTADLQTFYPSTVLVTGMDIIFFWVARMMMMSLHFMGEVPFKTVFMHALVRDEKGQKMSKSKGNVIDPLDLMKDYGADALRFTLASLAAPGRSVNFSTSVLEGNRNFATKVWNAARFCEHYGCTYDPQFDPTSARETVNRWILSELGNLRTQVEGALETYRLDEAATHLYQFIWGRYCDWYLEFAKPILEEVEEDSEGKAQDSEKQREAQAETRATCVWVLAQLCALLHPFMPFITEDLWEAVTKGKGQEGLLILAPWPSFSSLSDPAAEKTVSWWIRLISEIRTLRREVNIPAGAKLKLGLLGAQEETKRYLTAGLPFIQRLARLEEVLMDPDRQSFFTGGVVQAVLDEATLLLPLGGVMDVQKEKDRLKALLGEVAQDLIFLENKLGNADFLAKAPPPILEKNRQRQQELQQSHHKIEQALSRLAGVGEA